MIVTDRPSFGLSEMYYHFDGKRNETDFKFLGHLLTPVKSTIDPYHETEDGQFVYLAFLLKNTNDLFTRPMPNGNGNFTEKEYFYDYGKYVVILEGMSNDVFDIARFHTEAEAINGFHNLSFALDKFKTTSFNSTPTTPLFPDRQDISFSRDSWGDLEFNHFGDFV